MASPHRYFEVSVKPSWLYACMYQFPGYRMLNIIRSVRTRDRAPWMIPVFWEIDHACHVQVTHRRIKSEDMMGGEAWDIQYQLFPVCPGSYIPHKHYQPNYSEEETPLGGIPICEPA